MNLFCRMSNHVPASNTVENRGFAFSRCQRCRCDLIFSLGCSEARWRAVPPGFRVAWGGVDPRVFDRPTAWMRLLAALRRVGEPFALAAIGGCFNFYHSVSTLGDRTAERFRRTAAGITRMVFAAYAILAHLVGASRDGARNAARLAGAGVATARKVFRIRGDSSPVPQWNFVINLHLDPQQEPLVLHGLNGASSVRRQAFA